jgi:hypothetical protein
MRVYQNLESKIYGFNGPFFPGAASELNGHFLGVSDSLARTQMLCNALGKITGRPRTSDEYDWGWAVSAAGHNLLLIPDFGDPDCWDGRSIAVYNTLRTNNAEIQQDLELPLAIVRGIAARVAEGVTPRSY